jgi:hypothetical protein
MNIVCARWLLLGCVIVALGPAQARGEAYPQETGVTGPLVWNVGGTLLVPLDESADRVDIGGGFAVGLTFNPRILYGVQLEYGLSWASLKTGELANAGVVGDSMLQYFNLNGVVRPFRAGRAVLYLLGGGGLYYRAADVVRIDGVAVAPYCDPFLFYCSAVPVTTGSVIGSRSSWDWGLDAGVGLAFGVGGPVRVYLEARYHYIFGPTFTAAGGQERTADGQYLPITLGARF